MQDHLMETIHKNCTSEPHLALKKDIIKYNGSTDDCFLLHYLHFLWFQSWGFAAGWKT